MKHLFFVVAGFALLGLAACKDHGNEQALTQQPSDTTAMVVKPENANNNFIIEPPDSDYTGAFLRRYTNGNVMFKGSYRFGKRHGDWMAFYENGNLWSECFYDKGLKHGLSNVFYSNGKPQYKGWYKNDKRDSTWQIFDTAGVNIKTAYFHNDQLLREVEFPGLSKNKPADSKEKKH